MTKKTNSIVEIDLGAISRNVAVLKNYCNPATKFLAVIKADAYRHGAVEVAKKLSPQVDWFAVNDIYEAINLRENGIELPILVFMPPDKNTSTLFFEYGLTATIGNEEHLQFLVDHSEYHLLFDTGMGRQGFNPGEAQKAKSLQAKYDHLTCTGIYSHFATADEPNSSKIDEQLELFKKARSIFDENLLTHICNTGGIVQVPDAHFDMVRSGLGIYGYQPGAVDISGLQPALKWKSYLSQIKTIKKGDSVSYGSTWQCPEDGYLGIIPVGYDDGLPRRLTGSLQVKIENKYFEAVGIITMNYIMVYLQKQAFESGTEVLLLGDRYTANEWADIVGSISYEILTGISSNNHRKYD